MNSDLMTDTEYTYNHPLKKLTAVFNKNSSLQVISSYNYTYFTSGETTDLIWRETVSTGEAINNFVPGTTTYTNNSLNQVTSAIDAINAKTFLYDDDGNMTTGFTPEGYTLTMTYDAENRMKTAEYTDSNNIFHRTEYSYSGDSLLAEMKKYDGGILISTTRYLRAGFLPVQERDGNNSVTREYTWGLNLGGGIGGLLNLRQNSNDYSYLYDGKGNVSSLINGSQSVVASYRYDLSGVLMKKTATIEQPYMFSTKQYDEKLGFLRYEYRILMPEPGKWTTRDPLGEEVDINLYEPVDYGGDAFEVEANLYRHTGNDPVNYIDPLGLTKIINGLIYDDNGRLIGELPLEDPNPFLDPVNYIGGGTGCALKAGLKIETTYFAQGNIFKIISKRLKVGFRIDPPHHGKGVHKQFWNWWRKK